MGKSLKKLAVFIIGFALPFLLAGVALFLYRQVKAESLAEPEVEWLQSDEPGQSTLRVTYDGKILIVKIADKDLAKFREEHFGIFMADEFESERPHGK